MLSLKLKLNRFIKGADLSVVDVDSGAFVVVDCVVVEVVALDAKLRPNV